MSILAKLLRDRLTPLTGYATNLPGGIHPDASPQGNEGTHAVTQGVSREPWRSLAGAVVCTTERVQVVVVGDSTRAEAEAGAQWIRDAVEAIPPKTTVSGRLIHWLHCEESQDDSAPYEGGSPEYTRAVIFDVIGTYE